MCTKFDSSIRGMKNYSSAWIIETTNHRASNITDHVASGQHKVAMLHLHTEQVKAARVPIAEHFPIAKSLLALKKTMQENINKKFNTCYVMAKENIAFRKYPVLHEIEECCGVDSGQVYKTKDLAKNFTHYIAESWWQQFIGSLSNAQFFTFLIDGSIDAGNVEDKVVALLYCRKDDAAEVIRSCSRCFPCKYLRKQMQAAS